jgi:O-methyltransferase involved in polyketide biosynthesis
MDNIPDSLLIPLIIRAQDTMSKNPILWDKWALELCQKLQLDNRKLNQAQVSQEVQLSLLLRNRHFDQIVAGFLDRYPPGTVVYLGCGLDARFERLDNGTLRWYDLDLPEVINLRQTILGGETDRHTLLSCSALDHAWMNALQVQKTGQLLVIAEGLFMFFQDTQVRDLVLELQARFKGSELAFDAFSPFYRWGNNRRVKRTGIGSEANWALKDPRSLEDWANGIQLLDTWYPFLEEEPRLAHLRWVRIMPLLSKVTGVFHYRLN